MKPSRSVEVSRRLLEISRVLDYTLFYNLHLCSIWEMFILNEISYLQMLEDDFYTNLFSAEF